MFGRVIAMPLMRGSTQQGVGTSSTDSLGELGVPPEGGLCIGARFGGGRQKRVRLGLATERWREEDPPEKRALGPRNKNQDALASRSGRARQARPRGQF